MTEKFHLIVQRNKIRITTVIQTSDNGRTAQIPMNVVSHIDCLYIGEVLLGEMASESGG